MNTRNPVKAVERACNILSSFKYDSPELSITEISRLTGMYKSTAYRIVQTLIQHGFMSQDEKNKKYMLGNKIYELWAAISSNNELRRKALPFMEELRDKTGETVNLNVEQSGKRICIEVANSKEYIRNYVQIGMLGPLCYGATGKALLAFMNHKEIKKIIDQEMCDASIKHKEVLTKQLNEIKSLNYCISYSEREKGATAISAPIKNYDGKTIAVLTVSGPATRFTAEKVTNFIKYIKECALNISKHLGYTGYF